MSRDRILTFGLFLSFLSLAPSAFAQAVYGSIAGTVKDSSAATVPGATVTVTSVERKTVDTVVSNESGFYVKDRLLPGTYEVKAELSNFKAAVMREVRVSIDTQTRIDFVLAARAAQRGGRRDRRLPAAQDRPRRRLHQL